MKTCRYCGRENAHEVAHCLGCGTELAFGPVDAKPKESRDRTWIKAALRWVAAGIFMTLLYFLSLGPVTRYFATFSQSSTKTATGLVFQRTVSYPRWAAIVYAPALSLRGDPTSTFSELYDSYLDWWENPQTRK